MDIIVKDSNILGIGKQEQRLYQVGSYDQKIEVEYRIKELRW